MKFQIFFMFCCVITLNINGSITKEKEQCWNILCHPQLIVAVQACSYGTFFTAKQGKLCDSECCRQNMSVLLSLAIANKIERKTLSNNKTAFLITTGSAGYLALIFNPDHTDVMHFFNINQPSKTFPSDPPDVQELKRLIQPIKTNGCR